MNEPRNYLASLLSRAERGESFDLKAEAPRIRQILGPSVCQCGPDRVEVIDSGQGFYDRYGCSNCNKWDGPRVLNGERTW
ncbi:hypothetical protein UFOVP1382_105 [uncultured Caudovirales phage]|uniref:Uncharacterized protein n=1 Tax=uncultured Caudovirales phage TaxID=2100421 RepID=A0A6J5S4G1_9CAUD|nr:hypothetical protein UFOVP1382_105 [uncultured Caudovirales phage]